MQITETDFRDYEAVRLSGMTNMFDVELVGMLSGLNRSQIIDIMENYPAYKAEFLGVPNEKL